jgi:hypothetical protein
MRHKCRVNLKAWGIGHSGHKIAIYEDTTVSVKISNWKHVHKDNLWSTSDSEQPRFIKDDKIFTNTYENVKLDMFKINKSYIL